MWSNLIIFKTQSWSVSLHPPLVASKDSKMFLHSQTFQIVSFLISVSFVIASLHSDFVVDSE